MEINGIEVDVDLRYSEMNLSQGILKALVQKGFTLATPVQAGAIPCFKDWKDVMAKAPTGSGKTFAFGIPMVEHTDPEGTEVTGLVLAPTRELALQIQEELRQLCAFLPGIRVACLYGGQPIDRQITQLKKRPQIVVATPGRLMDHMKRRTVRLHKVETVVLDLQDRLYFNLPDGLYITSVDESSNSWAVGIRPRDLLISVNGQSVTSQEELAAALSSFSVGDSVNVIIYRSGRQLTADIVLQEATQ